MNYLVLIGDLVASRQAPDRAELQRKLAATLASLNRDGRGLVSPYTVTLGDEFQAVYREATPIFQHMFAILGALYPVGVRFAWSIGEITTEINSHSALGMDGPAFYAARDAITSLKGRDEVCSIAGLPADRQPLAGAALRVVSHLLGRWKRSRFLVMEDLLADRKVQDIASRLGMSEQAVYKNITNGGLEGLLELFGTLAHLANMELEA